MRVAARLIAIVVFAVVTTCGLRADDTANPKEKPDIDQPAGSATAPNAGSPALPGLPPDVSPDAQPDSSRMVPDNSSAGAQSGAPDQPVPATHSWFEPESDTPKVEWSVGYSFWRAMPTALSNRVGYLNGGSTSVAYNFNRYVGLAGDFSGFDDTRVTLLSGAQSRTLPASGSAFTYSVGPRFSFRKYERFTPFAQALFGAVHASPVTISRCNGAPSCTPLGPDTTFVTLLGAGIDLKLTHHVALRLAQGDFMLTHFDNPYSSTAQRGWQKNVRFSAGIVFRFGE